MWRMPSVPQPRSFSPAARRGERRARRQLTPDVDRRTAIVDFAVYRDGERQPDLDTWQEAPTTTCSGSGAGSSGSAYNQPSERQFAGIATRVGLHHPRSSTPFKRAPRTHP
jgi:hypothetical protein